MYNIRKLASTTSSIQKKKERKKDASQELDDKFNLRNEEVRRAILAMYTRVSVEINIRKTISLHHT